jgi:hypothetical protein
VSTIAPEALEGGRRLHRAKAMIAKKKGAIFIASPFKRLKYWLLSLLTDVIYTTISQDVLNHFYNHLSRSLQAVLNNSFREKVLTFEIS